ncbi:MAG: TlyA family RNA methyltransferase [Anaerolineae bacterium]|nr:MAG: TlyA family RNA methyltransferase [Anaerolineae bacterium]
MKKQRVDLLLVARGLAESRSLAQRLVMAGQVRAAGQVVAKPSDTFDESVVLEVVQGPKYVSRGGEKLEAAFGAFALDVRDLTCADVGASTGGFTDCLLQYGAARVIAIDVGNGILHWKIRQDTRVVVMEGQNARHLERLPEPVAFITVDASFISLKTLLPVLKGWYGEGGGQMLALVKPQFEAGQKETARGKGVIRDPLIHRRVLEEVLAFAEGAGYAMLGLVQSPVLGPKGNVEFLLWLGVSAGDGQTIETLLAAVQPTV